VAIGERKRPFMDEGAMDGFSSPFCSPTLLLGAMLLVDVD